MSETNPALAGIVGAMTQRLAVAQQPDPVLNIRMPAAAVVQRKRQKPRISKNEGDGSDHIDESLSTGEKLEKSITNYLNGPKGSIERLAFEVDPSQNTQHQGSWLQKLRGLPDTILKRISVQDDLVASIVNARANHLGAHGIPQHDRFSMGFAISPKKGVMEGLEKEAQEVLQKKIDAATKLLSTCGRVKEWDDQDEMSFSQYLFVSTKNAVVLGRIATEVLWAEDEFGRKRFHSFRPTDAGTIYKAIPKSTTALNLRRQAHALLERLSGKDLEPEAPGEVESEDIAWVQVLEGTQRQSFTSQEMVCYNFYPTADVEYRGYPVTPLDTAISAVTTHLNITTHNKLYFQTGRAARGILVIKSSDVDDQVITDIRQQFNAAINSVQNSWRVPVIGIDTEEEVNWTPTDGSQRDMEFQYLSDMTARVVLSAFQMSPEELPGYAHLSRGSANQALSEGNKEYQLTAARDVGLRPLLRNWEAFLNSQILPLLDADLVDKCEIQLVGVDALTAEKESIRIQQDAPLHMTYNEVLTQVEKDPIKKEVGGDFPFNQMWQAIADKYLTVGQIMEEFFGVKGASQDPKFAYVRDAFWFQWQQLQQQAQMMQQQQQQAAQQQAQGGGGAPPAAGGGGQGQGDTSKEASAQSAEDENQVAAQQAQGELGSGIDQAQQSLGKSEAQLTRHQRQVLHRHQATMNAFRKSWEQESATTLKEIVRAILADDA